jgi:hypothetical protein
MYVSLFSFRSPPFPSSHAHTHSVAVYPCVSAEHMARGLSAKAWVDSLVASAGRGKGGGKADLANGSFPVLAADGTSTGTPEEFVAQILAWSTEYANGILAASSK